MSIGAHQTCPHCRAIVTSTICGICGRSAYEEVTPKAPVVREKWWRAAQDQLRKLGLVVVAVLVVGGAAVWFLTRPAPEPVATELPPPASTTLPAAERFTSPRSPTLVGGGSPDGIVTLRSLPAPGSRVAPWETPPPLDYVTGSFLDDEVDFSADQARVDEILAAFPNEVPSGLGGAALTVAPLDPPVLATFGGSVPVADIEASQPLRARRILRVAPGDDGADRNVGEVWVIASAGTPDGDRYLAAARERWSVDLAVDTVVIDDRVRLWSLGGDETRTVWVTGLGDDALVIVQSPTGTGTDVLTAALDAWEATLTPSP